MESVSKQSSGKSVPKMFDEIAPVYDKLNHILSFGLDYLWRSRLARLINRKKKLKILDLATGTGDLLITLLRKNPDINEAVGLDISENMLRICSEKISRYNLNDKVNLICADVNSSDLSDNTFDLITIGFGIRNTYDSLETLKEIFRLLKPGATTYILEFSVPSNSVIKFLYLPYLRFCVPFIGRIISGNKHAYRYLNTSIEKFYRMDEFKTLMKTANFEKVEAIPLTFGIVCIYKGSKSN